MANKQTVIAALATLALLSCAPQSSETATADSAAAAVADPAVVRSAIETANTKAADALKKGDIETLLQNYAPDAILMMPNAPAWSGIEGIRAGGKAFFDQVTISDVKFQTTDVKVAGDLAIETGTIEMTVTPKKGGKAMTDKGKYLTVWQKQADGSWKVIRDINNSDLPPTG